MTDDDIGELARNERADGTAAAIWPETPAPWRIDPSSAPHIPETYASYQRCAASRRRRWRPGVRLLRRRIV